MIVILSDDQGWADIGYNNPKVYTPNLDRLARSGVRFENHYVMPQCTPTRVALMTGRYPGRFGPPGPAGEQRPRLPPRNRPPWGASSRPRGTRPTLCGKWHLGSMPEHGPNRFGFDESYGTFTGAVGMYDHRYRKGKFEHTWHRNHELIEGAENGTHATDLVAREAVKIIETKREKPFFLYLPFHAPHTPLDERGAFVDRPTQLDPDRPGRWLDEDEIPWFNDPEGRIQQEPDPEKRLFLAVVHHLDHAIGRIVKALEDTGQRDDTLILFSSDNGPQGSWGGKAYPDDLKLTDFNQPLPMRGKKVDVWEGGIHVPAFASWPGRIAPGTIPDATHIIDWFPTLASLLGHTPDKPIPWDGVDLTPVIFGDETLKQRDLYWIWAQRTNRWALRHGDWKIVNYGREEPAAPGAWQLFDLTKDPREKRDVAKEHPKIVEDLQPAVPSAAREGPEGGLALSPPLSLTAPGTVLMNLYLMGHGYPPAIILKVDRKRYYRVLNEANLGKRDGLDDFIGRAIERSLILYLNSIEPDVSEDRCFITLKEATRYCDYSQDYFSLLARKGKLEAVKIDRNCMTTK